MLPINSAASSSASHWESLRCRSALSFRFPPPASSRLGSDSPSFTLRFSQKRCSCCTWDSSLRTSTKVSSLLFLFVYRYILCANPANNLTRPPVIYYRARHRPGGVQGCRVERRSLGVLPRRGAERCPNGASRACIYSVYCSECFTLCCTRRVCTTTLLTLLVPTPAGLISFVFV